MKVYYISGCIPYNGKTGGRLACYNHILQLSKEFDDVQAFFIDLDCDADFINIDLPDNVSYEIYCRNRSNKKNLYNIILMLFNAFFSLLPRSMDVVYSNILNNKIKNIYLENPENIFIVDQMDVYANIKNIEGIKYIYISHNVESKMIKDKILADSKLLFFINFIKTSFFERKVIKNSIKTLFISSEDEKKFKKFKNTCIYPEFIPAKEVSWKFHTLDKSILFLGSSHHYPNKEATLWIIQEFAPKLYEIDPSINIKICGLNSSDIKLKHELICENVTFLGRVSDQELKDLFISSRLFLSPIILGSGIKMKVLEASSYGCPIFCTPESISGLDYLTDLVNSCDRNDVDIFVKEMIDIFYNHDELLKQSKKILNKLYDMQNISNNYFN